MDPQEFFKTLWGEHPPGVINIWRLPDRKSSWHRIIAGINELLAKFPHEEVYTGVSLADQQKGRFTTGNRIEEVAAGAIAGVWADIDVFHEVHTKAEKLPPDRDAARAVMEQLPYEPTLIIDSGHGLQYWWLFKKPWVFGGEGEWNEARRTVQWWHQMTLKFFTARGWTIDSVYDLSRILRIPGTFNNKVKDDPKEVVAIKTGGPRYAVEDFTKLVPEEFVATSPAPEQLRGRRGRTSYDTASTTSSGLILDPNAEPGAVRLNALAKVDKKFHQSWDRNRPDLKDQSASSYNMSLADIAVRAGWPDQEVVNLMICWRRRHGEDLKLRENYYARTIAKAHEPMEREKVEEDQDVLDDPQDAEEDAPEDQSAHSGGSDEPGSQGSSDRSGAKAGKPEDPSPIMAKLPEQGDVQVPRVIGPLVRALTELAACTPRGALAGLLGAISALASGDADLEWPNEGDVTPLTLFVLHLAESGSRKSSAWSRAFHGHRIADRQVIERWEEAKAEYGEAMAASKGQKKGDSDDDLPVPLGSSPVILRRDATIEVLVRRLARGRREQCWETSEAGTLIGGWSFSRETRGKTFSDLQDLWSDGIVQLDRVKDDVEIMVHDARLTLAWSCQCKIGRDLILGESSGNGFAARCLLSADDHLPEYRPKPGNWPDGQSARWVMQQFSDWVANVRGVQDYVHKGKAARPERTTYRLSPEAWEAVDQAGALAHGAAADEDLTQHERSFLARVGENAGRVAAVLSYYRNTRCDGDAIISSDDAIISSDDAHDAIAVVRSSCDELQRQGVWAAATADADAATWATKRLAAVSDRYLGARRGTWRINHWLSCEGAGPAKNLRGDPEARARIIELLESHGWISKAGRGVWTINPAPGDGLP